MGAHTTEGLRTILDSDDLFLTSHQITKKRSHIKRCPEWVKHDRQIKELLKFVFPRLIEKSDKGSAQRKRAGRWARVIHLYFRTNLTYKETAEEMGEKPKTIEGIIRRVLLASEGKRTNGSGVYSKKCGNKNPS